MAKDYVPGERFIWQPGDLEVYDSIEESDAFDERLAQRRAKHEAENRFVWDMEVIEVFDSIEELDEALEREAQARGEQ